MKRSVPEDAPIHGMDFSLYILLHFVCMDWYYFYGQKEKNLQSVSKRTIKEYQNLPNMFLLRGNNLNSLIQNRHPFLIQNFSGRLP